MKYPLHMIKRKQSGRALFIALGVVATIILLIAAYVWVTLSWSYADGERAGYIQKFSRKGWLCKTWEGEIALVNLPGQVAEIFRFSVRDAAIAQKINAVVGKRVALKYEQHKGVPTNCFAETEYFVTDVRVVEGSGQM